MFSAGGMRGCKCIRFPGFSKEELPNEILIIEIKGLGLSQDLNPNSDAVGYVIFSQGKGDTATGQDDIEENISISVKV